MSLLTRCAQPGCREQVRGIYCPLHREERAREQAAAKEANAERLREMSKELWATRREELIAALKAGHESAKEGRTA